MKKKSQYYEQNQENSNKENFPLTIKNNERGRNTTYHKETSQESIDSPIKQLKLSRDTLKDSNPQNIDSATGRKVLETENNQNRSDKNLRLKDNVKKQKQKQEWPHEQEQIQSPKKTKQQQEKLSKIQTGNQQVIELPVEKADTSQYLSEEEDEINEMDLQKSESPHELNQVSPKLQKEQTPYQETKRSVSQIPSTFNYFPSLQHKSDRAQIRHSRSITDSIMSPQFEKYLGQSHKSSFRPKLSCPLYHHKGYHHNQCLHMVQSETLPKGQNAHYRTTFIKEELKLTLANNLDKILFKYNGGHAKILYNNKLKIKNDSPVNVEVKIMCTSPSHYEVRPFSSVVLCPSQVLGLLIEMKLYVQDINHLTMKHDLSRYKNDKFKICYWANEFCPEIWYERGEKVLPVVIEDTEQERIRSKGLIEDKNKEELKMIAGEKNILMYKTMIEQTKNKIRLLDLQICDVNKNKVYSSYLTKTVLWLVIIIGLAIGFWLG